MGKLADAISSALYWRRIALALETLAACQREQTEIMRRQWDEAHPLPQSYRARPIEFGRVDEAAIEERIRKQREGESGEDEL